MVVKKQNLVQPRIHDQDHQQTSMVQHGDKNGDNGQRPVVQKQQQRMNEDRNGKSEGSRITPVKNSFAKLTNAATHELFYEVEPHVIEEIKGLKAPETHG